MESLGLDESEIFNAYHEIPSIRDKDEFLIPFIDTLTNPNFKTGTQDGDQQLLRSLIVFSCLMEGLFFYVGFVDFSFRTSKQDDRFSRASISIYYVMSLCTVTFGIDLVNTIKLENPDLWTTNLRKKS